MKIFDLLLALGRRPPARRSRRVPAFFFRLHLSIQAVFVVVLHHMMQQAPERDA